MDTPSSAELQELGVDAEYQTVDGSDVPVSYRCTGLRSTNVTTLEPLFYYDYRHHSLESVAVEIALLESRLLNSMATTYGLITQDRACVQKPDNGLMWVDRASSRPDDVPNKQIPVVYTIRGSESCLTLQARSAEESCSSYVGRMQFDVVGKVNEDELIDQIRAIMDSGELDSGTNGETLFLGTMMEAQVFGDAGKDHLPPAVNAADAPRKQSSTNDRVTPEGVFFISGLIAAFIVLSLVVFRAVKRRERKFRDKEEDEVSEVDSDGVLGHVHVQTIGPM